MKDQEGKQLAEQYYNQEAEEYINQYQGDYTKYPFNLIRINMVSKYLKANNIRTVLDVGCGTCGPMIKLLKEGFDVYGLDFAKDMVDAGKVELNKAGFHPDRVWLADLEKSMVGAGLEKYDAIIALGVFPHLLDERKTLNNMKNVLNKNGMTFVSFRNKLFATFTFNNYSQNLFLDEMINVNELPDAFRMPTKEFINSRCNVNADRDKTKKLVYNDILARLHNPLTISEDLYDPCGFKVESKLFYHYHVIPPALSNIDNKMFNALSVQLENPEDWRGHFMASAFVVGARLK